MSLNIGESDFVLEVGSGDNPNPRSNILCDLYLEDNSERVYGRALKKGGRPFVLCDAENLPFKRKSFDYLIAASLIEHLERPENFIKEAERVASRGYIETPTYPIRDSIRMAFSPMACEN